MKHRFLFFLILMLSIFCISCEKEEPKEPTDFSTVFREELLPLPNDCVIAAPANLSYNGDTIALTLQKADETTVRASFNTDGTLRQTENRIEPYTPYHDDFLISDSFTFEDHIYLTYEILYTESSADAHAVLRDGDTVYFSVSPASDLGYDLHRDNPFAGTVFEVSNALAVPMGDDTLYVLLTSEGLCAYNKDGTLLWSLRDKKAVDITYTDDTLLYLTVQKSKQTLYAVNTSDGTTENIAFADDSVIFSAMGTTSLFLHDTVENLYATNDLGIYSITLTETDSTRSADAAMVFDFTASGILPSAIHEICMADRETAFLITNDLSGGSSNRVLARYTMLPQSEIPQKETLTLALFSEMYTYQLPVFYFNRQSQTHQIVIRDYTVYEREERYTVFQMDIAAGNIPDMVILWEYSNMDPTISAWEYTPLFADLTPLLTADTSFGYDDLLSYVTKPYTHSDGKQIYFPLTPEAHVNMGAASIFDGPVTIDEYLTICENHGYSPYFGMNLFGAAIDDYYDMENAVCNFNDGKLQSQMERANALSNNGEEKLLKSTFMPYTSLWNYKTAMAAFEEPMVMVGAPNEQRKMYCGYIMSDMFAITENCKSKSEAVKFLKLLLDDKTPEIQTYSHFFPGMFGYTFFKHQIAEQLAEFEGKTIVLRDQKSYFLYDDDDLALADAIGERVKVTQEDADGLYHYLDSITNRVNYASPAANIFWDVYFDMDDRPVSDMLDMAQSKISIYLSEQFG